MSEALTLLGAILSFFTNTGAFLAGALHWFSSTFFPPQLQTWFLGTISTPGQTWNAASVYESVYQAMQGPALLIVAVASMARVLRVTLDHRAPATHAITDSLPRLLFAVALIGIPGSNVSPGYTLLVFSVNAAMAVTSLLFDALLQASLLQGLRPGEGWFDHVVGIVTSLSNDLVAVVVGAIPLLILVLYASFLMVARTVMLGFCIATAPLCLATAVFEPHNRFVQWWMDLFIGVLLTPMVLAIAVSLSITIASNLVTVSPIGPILAFVVMCGGLWFSSKLIHHMSWRHFSHGSAMAGFAAGVTTMLSPLHKLATAGFIAEALGANKAGTNVAVNAMKRLGLAAQGLSPGTGTPSLLAPAVGGISSVMEAPGAASAFPDMASALGSSGRSAVTGSERTFSSHAFQAFTRSQPRLIGTLTRDQPYGTLSSADRARLAWDRTSPREQAAFADEFLSHWLGSDQTEPVPDQTDSLPSHEAAA